ncbi:FAD-dependent oxidoreductase [Pseudogemmobacter sonorensis]|uniref:FAD-dependent oxidoreductase n=1 Tax=Pseudogemmobacter sonorensis TaxID=2989681 RepID=UPI0036869915
MAFDCDLFVIGGGSGGVRAARMAAATGAKVALAEESRMGGTCVIRGCVPKKLMVYASGFRDLPAEARAYGWDIAEGHFDWTAFRTRLHAELDRLEGVYRGLLAGSGIAVHDQRARLVDPHQVELADGTRIAARHILIATGGRPDRPEIPGAEAGMVSDDVFGMERLPGTLAIQGGGFIACEMASIFAGLGVKVTQFHRGTQILRGFDDEARALIAESIRETGVDLQLDASIAAIGPRAQLERADLPASEPVPAARALPPGEPLAVRTRTGTILDTDAVLFATGRRPNTEGLGLEDLGVRLGRRGEILVDAYSQSSVPSIHAIGDVTDRVNLTPVAIREGMAFSRTVFEGIPTAVDHDLIASAVFTRPELGSVGLTEEEARAQEPIEVYATAFRPMRSAFAGSEARVMMKLLVSQATRRVLGCHIVAPEAGEMIQLAAIAIKMGATKEDFDRTCAVHPTMAEELVTMRSPVRRD